MQVRDMREFLAELYPSRKFDRVPDAQVIAVYNRIMAQRTKIYRKGQS